MNKQIENEMSASYGTVDPRKCVGFDATDCDDERLGVVESVWRNAGADAPFFNVRTGWLGFGRAYGIPAHRIRVDKQTRELKLPYPKEVIKRAPAFKTEHESLENHRENVRKYYAAHDSSVQAMDGFIDGRASHDAERVVGDIAREDAEVEELVTKKSDIDVETLRRALS